MTQQVTADEEKQRLQAIEDSDTWAEAGEKIGMTGGGLHRWAVKNGHHESGEREGSLPEDERRKRREAIKESSTYREAAEKLDGVKYTALKEWARTNGVESAASAHRPMRCPREPDVTVQDSTLPVEEVRRRVRALREAESVQQAADELDMPYTSLYNWAWLNGVKCLPYQEDFTVEVEP